MIDNLEYDAWNPGIQSQIPSDILPLSTIFRPENIVQTFAELNELNKFTGMKREDLATYRPERLVIHELMIRVLANYAIPDGRQYEDLGFNFREMVSTLLEKHLQPHMPQIISRYDEACTDIRARVDVEITKALFTAPTTEPQPTSFFSKLFKPKKPKPQPVLPEVRDSQILDSWQQEASKYEDAFEHHLFQSLHRVCSAIMNIHGRIRGEQPMLVELVSQQLFNIEGSKTIGATIEPMIISGAHAEGYQLLPSQAHPIVMNVKGSSASGKSTLRPLQKRLARKLGLCWDDFALVSPDIFRKFLLDYPSLGAAYKYAGACTSLELKAVDQKLDAYMTEKGHRHTMPHLLIDRFRFDSFSEEAPEEEKHLLTRFGEKVFMFFMVTPPEATVERAWIRGLKVGRFKAVDDLLDHNVEAYSGMPDMFFTWALNQTKEVHYEFLDNSVELGQIPRTIAFGQGGDITILDVKPLIDIQRYPKINIEAQTPDAVYPLTDNMATAQNMRFLKDISQQLKKVEFADGNSLDIYARIEAGILKEWQPDIAKTALPDDDIREALFNLFANQSSTAQAQVSPPQQVDNTAHQTLGSWGREKGHMREII